MKKILAMCALLCLPLSALASDDYMVLFKKQGTFQDVRDSIQFSIEGKGLKINHTNKIAEMLARTGTAVARAGRYTWTGNSSNSAAPPFRAR